MTARNISEHNIKWICPSHLISVGPIGAFLTLKCQMSNVKLLKTVNNHTSSWLFTTTLQVVGLVRNTNAQEQEREKALRCAPPRARPSATSSPSCWENSASQVRVAGGACANENEKCE